MKMLLSLTAIMIATAAHANPPPCLVYINALGQSVTCCSQADGSQCCSDAVNDKGQPVGCSC